MTPVTLTFLGASGTVTGSKYLLTIGERRVLVDAGMYQGDKAWNERNYDAFPVDPASIDCILLTHAHADHSSYLPALVKHGFRGPIYATEGTIALATIVLRDAGHLQENAAKEAKQAGYASPAPSEPLYTSADAEATIPLFKRVEFDTPTDCGQGLSAQWTRAGHILGSASITVSVDGEPRVLFSGDLGRLDHPILKPRETPPGAPYVLIESTYGDREHPEPNGPTHVDFADAINRTVKSGGTVVVPAFAIDRIETVLRTLTEMTRAGRIPDVPVFVDGPMSLAALKIYEDTSLHELRDDITVGDFAGLRQLKLVTTPAESKAIAKDRRPKIVVASSGMAEGGRVVAHLRRFLPDPKNCVVLTGYQGEGTRGRELEEGAPQVKIQGTYVAVRARIVRDHEFSVHGDASDLLDWLKALDQKPETVFVVHGDPGVAPVFAQRIHAELGFTAVVPQFGESVTLTPELLDADHGDEAATTGQPGVASAGITQPGANGQPTQDSALPTTPAQPTA